MHQLFNDVGTIVLVLVSIFVLLVVMGRLEPRRPSWRTSQVPVSRPRRTPEASQERRS